MTPVVVQEIVPPILYCFPVTGWKKEMLLVACWHCVHRPHWKLPSDEGDNSWIGLVWRQSECLLRFLTLRKVLCSVHQLVGHYAD